MEHLDILKTNIFQEIDRLKSEGHITNTYSSNLHPMYDKEFYLNCSIPDYELINSTTKKGVLSYPAFQLRIDNSTNSPTEDSSTYKSNTIVDVDLEFFGYEKVNFVHDFTFNHIATKTDVKLSEWVEMKDFSDKLTPDMCIINGNDIAFVEFTTNRTNSVDVLKREVRKKHEKYDKEISKRVEYLRINNITDKPTNAYLFVICVGRKWIVTTFPIIYKESTFIHELMTRYTLSLDIELRLVHAKVIPSSKEEELSSDMTSLKLSFHRMQYYLQNDTQGLESCLTEENLHHFVNPSMNRLTTRNGIINVMKKSIKIESLQKLSKESGFTSLKKTVEDKSLNITQEDALSSKKLHVSNTSIRKSHEVCLSSINDYIKSVNTPKGKEFLREDLKSIVPFPCVILYNNNSSFDSTGFSITNSLCELRERFNDTTCATGIVWTELLFKITSCYAIPDDESLEDQFLRALEPKTKNDKMKYNYHRIKIDLDFHEKIELAMVGIQKREYQYNSIVDNYVKSKQIPFSLDTYTGDISDFIEKDGMVLFNSIGSTHYVTDTVLDILIDAVKLHYTPEDASIMKDIVNKILSTGLMRWAKLISDIACEIDISLKQNVGKDTFIVKELKDHHMYIAIRPTSQGGIINYSLLWHQDHSDMNDLLYCSVFPSLNQCGKFFYTDFRSTNINKLVNQTSFETMMFNSFVFWLNEYKIDIFKINNFSGTNDADLMEAKRMTLFTSLIILEDKKVTEEVLTTVRYIYMEGFVSFPKVPNPSKMIQKLPSCYKSRLAIFSVHKVLNLMKYITMGNYFHPTIRRDDVENTISFRKNMINFITGSKIEDLNNVINLMYLGYCTNKNELMEGNKVNKLYKKIIEMEKKFTKEIQSKIGILEKDELDVKKYDYHEYSPSLLYHGCDLALKKLIQTRGKGVKNQIEEDILRTLSLTDMLGTFGTLKSSSTFDSENDFQFESGDVLKFRSTEEKKKIFKENDTPTRSKVLIQSMKYLKDYPTLAELLPICMDEITADDRIDVDLFDKAQHGGIREIFILNFKTRVCQYVLETISRTICSYFPSEMMTHPTNKDRLMVNHNKISVLKSKGQPFITVATSDDAEKWNQCHFVGKFGQMLCFFLPEYMWPFVSNILRLWFKRRIKIDPRLIKIMEMNENLKVEDPVFQEMYNIYKGKTNPTDWYVGKKKRYINIKSGFMQGILHYTSSLYHVISLELTHNMSNDLLGGALKFHKLSRDKATITSMVSSDDSSMIISLPAHSTELAQSMCIVGSMCFEMKNFIGRTLGIYLSIKSTQNTLFCMEFNSIFNFSESRHHAFIKQVFATSSISEKESLVSRQEELSNTLTSVLENGGSFMLTSLCQFGQGLLFYRLLGSSAVPILTRKVVPSLKVLRDPSVGYFLMDNPSIAGTSGLKYNLWNLVTNDGKMNCLYKYMLDNSLSKDESTDIRGKNVTLHTTSTGLFTNSLIIPYGENKRLQKVQEDFEADESVYETINENPSILYSRPRTSEELMIMAKLKLLSPGVTESFSKSMSISRLMAQSVFLIVNSILIEGANYYSTTSHLKGTRTSLTKRLMDNIEVSTKSETPLTDNEISILFPLNDEFKSLKRSCGLLSMSVFLKKFKRARNVKSTIIIQDVENSLVPINQIVAWKWFGKNAPMSNTIMRELWARLCSITWLKDCPKDTLKLSPFNNHYQLMNFFSRMDITSRKVHLLGAPLGVGSHNSNLITLACRNPWKGYETPLKFDDQSTNEARDYKLIKHIIHMTLNSPLTPEEKLENVKNVLRNSEDIHYKHLGMNNMKANLYFMQKFLKLPPTDKKGEISNYRGLLQEIVKSKFGIIGGYPVRQDRVKNVANDHYGYAGQGKWIGKINDVNCRMILNSRLVEGIHVPYLEELYISTDNPSPGFFLDLRELCKQMRISNSIYSRFNSHVAKFKMLDFFKSSNGCDVFYEQGLRNITELPYAFELDFEVVDMTLKLKITHKFQFTHYHYNILSFVSKESDYDILSGHQFCNDYNFKPFLETWIRDSPMDFDQILILISRYQREYENFEKKLDPLQFRLWLKNSFYSSCQKLGLMSRKIFSKESTDDVKDDGEIVTLDDIDDLLGSIDVNFDNFVFEEEVEMQNVNVDLEDYIDIPSSEMEDLFQLLNPENSEELDSPRQMSILYNNNICLNFVREVLKLIDRVPLHAFLNQYKISRSMTDDMIELLCFVTKTNRTDYYTEEKIDLKKNRSKLEDVV